MKMLSKLSFLPFIFLGFAAEAQTETVAPKAKILQQLYLSVGTGPAVIGNEDRHPFGGNFEVNLTKSICTDYLFRVGFKRNAFVGTFDPETSVLSYLDLGYNNYFIPSTHINSGQLLVGKRKLVNQFIQLQAFGGLSFNQISKPDRYPTWAIETFPAIWEYRLEQAYKPGAVIQAEAMFMPTRFAGLTLGGYYHYVPEISNGGLTLSLNLGKLRSKEIL